MSTAKSSGDIITPNARVLSVNCRLMTVVCIRQIVTFRRNSESVNLTFVIVRSWCNFHSRE